MKFFRNLFAKGIPAPMRDLVKDAIVPVPGINANEDGSPWSDPKDTERNGAEFPHCDDLVLHRPGTCKVCESYPRSQAARLWMGVAFTNDPEPHPLGFMRCPSLVRRPRDVIEQWPGNRP